VHARGHAINPAAASSPNAPLIEFETGGIPGLGDMPGTTMLADQTPYEQREAQFTTALPDQRAQVAIRTAMAQIGLPYVWGGDGPTNGDAGFDCSGLTTFSYAAAGVSLPRTAHTQYYKGPHVPQGAPLHPGDLVFYGTPAKVHHVGLYLGDGKMVNAPTFGKPVQTAFYRYSGDDYLGATRPAATGQTTSGLLPYAPAAPSTGTPETFPAPVAPAPTEVPDATASQPAEAVSAADAAAAAAVVTSTVTVAPTTTAAPATSASPAASASATPPSSSPPRRPRSSSPPPPPPPVTVTVTVPVPEPETEPADPPTSPSESASAEQSSSVDVTTTTAPPAS
jgi:hypothetical protein